MMNPASGIILIIDDDSKNIKTISDFLKESGFEPAAAPSGKTGIKRAETLKPELILLDVMMPETDGYETCRLLKSCEVTKDIPVIFMTAPHSLEDKIRAFSCGGVDYIAKPVQPEEVLARVSIHLQIRRQTLERGTALLTPVNAIDNMAKLLAETQLTPEQRAYTATILSNSRILLGLLSDIPDFSKAVPGKAQNPCPGPMPHESSPDTDVSLSGIRILLVEDHPINQKVIQSIMKKHGLGADIANNGREAVDILEKQDYDLVLMDIQMPVMDGEKAAEIIRSPDSAVRNHHIPIIALTAHAMKGDRESCLFQGMNDYIAKPVNADKLIAAIRRHLPGIRAQASSAERQKTPDLPENEEQSIFDKEEFMDRLSTDEQVCREFLSGVPKHIVRDIERLQNSICAEDHFLTAIHAHNLKGVAANLSAGRLQNRAEAIECAAKNTDTVRLRSLMAGLEQEAALFFDCLKASGLADRNPLTGSLLPDPNNNAEIPNLSALPSHLHRELANALTALDMEKISSLISEIRSYDSRVSEILKKMADDFEYSEMIHLLRKGADSESAPADAEKTGDS